MRIAIVGASGNMGTALLRNLQGQLAKRPGSLELVGVSRRLPDTAQPPYAGVEWHTLDVGQDDDLPRLRSALAGVDAVVHLAWQLQPNRDLDILHRTNVTGTGNVLEAAREAGVGHIVCASSVGAYSKAPKDQRTDESWPAGGIQGSHYSQHKAEQEALLDRFETEQPDVKVARLRPGLIFQRDAGSEIGRYFLGPLLARLLPRRVWTPVLPVPDDLIFQAVHADDAAEAYWQVLDRGESGAFNIAAEPVVTPQELARLLGARRILPIPVALLHALAALTWRLRLQPTDPGWVDMAAGAPVMDTGRARRLLAWEPRISSIDAIVQVLDGIGAGDGVAPSPALKPRN
ncbi:NAD-dependent epimerase/dehydratase family protein [Arthrobacter sp. ISL-48]|uniref:NAD-dependent epimerase/dehydratase family protein n=1 Tax=Arthrobacter sp. ISL-48 TaxID=2819110 RepID=UPI001BECB6CE|nr:NAD-dependent epimerase/dehydratase family protein [Arthrobacter sp. ISL-48]MBT2531042.1 NAD-dependent epimerase/dehydratase family protein [Arthrobacter sp. ISL-48]